MLVVQTKCVSFLSRSFPLASFAQQGLELATIQLRGFLLPGAVDFLAATECLWVVVADVASFARVNPQ